MIKDNEQEDLEFTRNIYLNLLNQSNEAIGLMMELLRESESPRCGEVTANLIRSTADIADKIVDLHKSNKDLSKKDAKSLEDQSNRTTNNNVFIGSTEELQKLLQGNKEEKVVADLSSDDDQQKDNE